ncbi:bifunctional diguanylate cyclase/phosphodiesterase [Herminiimonas sp. CN]|uniref:putative bifunctional diguanylate cyclase/phosphodiesterase n=1 Tax=Herminiimonas sp. CN TaxID=1349818 RepID=UPI001EE6889B|nr:EAL domain-containing protein [Herminiimonas sp. CN]
MAYAFNDSAQRIGNLITYIEQDRQSLRQAEAMFRELAENSVVGVYIVQDDAFRFVNAKMAEMFDYEPAEMMASVGVLDIVAEDQRQLVTEGIRKRLSGEVQEVHYERQARKKDGSLIDIEVFGSRMRIDGRDATIGIMLDITKRKAAEMSEHLMTLVYQNSSEGMVIADAVGVIVTVNPAFTEITGYQPDEVVGNKLNILNSGRHDQAFYQAMWRAINTIGHWRGEIWNRRKNGEVFVELLTINTAYNEDGTVYRRIGVFSDITDRKHSEAVVWEQANFDFLTRLPNRHMFHDRLQQEITKSHRAALPLALLFLDLDQFKEVNDTLGHAVGDRLLKQAAQRLSSCVRESDTVARLGGDEFTIILSELKDVNVVKRIAQNILEKLTQPFMLEEEEVFISVSIGITLYPDDATEIEDLIKNADQAMYAAKDQGRNQLNYFARSMQEAAQSRRWLVRDLRGALAGDQFCLHYQPIVNLTTGSVDKAEALIRWQHPVRGLISPAEFIPVAEDTGMIIEIGDWVFRQAAQQVALWRSAQHAQFQISINTSAVQFRRGGIVHDEWLGYLRRLGLPGHSIAIEITERLLMDAGTGVTDKLRAFRAAGIQVALDDFGTGYSSMSYLKKFDIDYLKIDQSFVRNLMPGSDDLALCEAIIVMAHKLGMKVIAEGIETEQQRDLLAAAGCDFGQGYLFSRPVAAEQFQAFLKPDFRILSDESQKCALRTRSAAVLKTG